jgi:hypothetical protein
MQYGNFDGNSPQTIPRGEIHPVLNPHQMSMAPVSQHEIDTHKEIDNWMNNPRAPPGIQEYQRNQEHSKFPSLTSTEKMCSSSFQTNLNQNQSPKKLDCQREKQKSETAKSNFGSELNYNADGHLLLEIPETYWLPKHNFGLGDIDPEFPTFSQQYEFKELSDLGLPGEDHISQFQDHMKDKSELRLVSY